MLLTAELLLHYQRCHRRAFLDACGDKTQKDPRSDFQRKLLQDRLQHQQSTLLGQGYEYRQPEYPYGDWAAATRETIALMEQGLDYISGGILLASGEDVAFASCISAEPLAKFSLLSNPDLLIKQPGRSRFGDWVYVPMDIHIGKRPKQEYQVVAAYHTQILATIQGAWPQIAWLNLRDRGIYEVDLWQWLPLALAVEQECAQMLLAGQMPDLFISRQLCSLCPWLSYCYSTAKAQQHLSLVPGITPIRYQQLQALGMLTLESVAAANPVYLEPQLDTATAQQVVRQAQSSLSGQVILHLLDSIDLSNFLPSAAIELYFDIEAQPDLKLDYLLGVLVVDKAAQTQTFYPLLAEDLATEANIWQEFLDLVWRYPQAPIFHFSAYEAETVKRLAKLYDTPAEQVDSLLERFVDLHVRVTNAVTLPIESYSLKNIANWLGFEWRNPQANGSQCIYWYEQWLHKRDRSFLDAIVSYNEDDCRATWRVKHWLAEFLHQDSRPDTYTN